VSLSIAEPLIIGGDDEDPNNDRELIDEFLVKVKEAQKKIIQIE
jgi:hypothetical protein